MLQSTPDVFTLDAVQGRKGKHVINARRAEKGQTESYIPYLWGGVNGGGRAGDWAPTPPPPCDRKKVVFGLEF